MEESTTLVKEPTQGKICNLSGFLDSLPFARNDMSMGGAVLSQRVVFLTEHGDESSPLHCVVPFNHTGYFRNVAGGRLPPLRFRWWVDFLPNVFQKRTRPSPNNCQLSTENNCQLKNRVFLPPWGRFFASFKMLDKSQLIFSTFVIRRKSSKSLTKKKK